MIKRRIYVMCLQETKWIDSKVMLMKALNNPVRPFRSPLLSR